MKRIGLLLAKLIELYPTCASSLVLKQLCERLPHYSASVDLHYQYSKLVFQIAKAAPNTEEKLLEAVISKLCQLDSDIKSPKSYRKCGTFSSFSRI